MMVCGSIYPGGGQDVKMREITLSLPVLRQAF